MTIDLTSYESNLALRLLTSDDIPAIVALQLRCFPGMSPWQEGQLRSQLALFPEGQIGIEIKGRLVATSASLIVDSGDYDDWHDWHSISDSGWIKNHDPEGDTLYGIEMQVDPEFRGLRLSRRLYEARKTLARQLNLAGIMIGGRIAGFSEHSSGMTAQEYVAGVLSKRFVDPVLTAQLSNGFVLKRLIPDYLPSDEDSGGWATQLEWANLDHVPRRGGRRRRATRPVRVAAVNYPMRSVESWDDFARQVRFFADTAGDYNADFLLFPELFTLQLLSLVDESRPGLAARALAEFTPRYIELLTSLAVRYNVNIVGGSQFGMQGDTLMNFAYLFRRDGTIARQAKLHVTPSEARWWGIEGGDTLDVFETDCGKVAMLICYDVEFPELVRRTTELGARILFVPYNTNDRPGHLRVRTCAQARCIENEIYEVTAGCVGNLPEVENADIHYGQSAVFTPSDIGFARDGVAAEAAPNVETVIVHDLDVELLRQHRLHGTVKNWNDRRQDLYRVQWLGGGRRDG